MFTFSGHHGADRAGWGFPIVPKDVADELLQKEVRNGCVQWCANRAELEEEVELCVWRKLPSLSKDQSPLDTRFPTHESLSGRGWCCAG